MSEFKLVAAYDDLGNAICARGFIDRLVEGFGEFLTIIPCFLKFEELSERRAGAHFTAPEGSLASK
jgi:hypothetical protein